MIYMEEEKIIESLSPIERKVLPHLRSGELDKISEKSNLDKTSVLRAVEFLKKKGLVESVQTEKKFVVLGINGIYYQKKQLPERRLLVELGKKQRVTFGEIASLCKLNENEVKVAIGILKRKALVEIVDGKVSINAKENEINKLMPEELLIEKLPLEVEKLAPEEKFAVENLKSRKDIIAFEDRKEHSITLTKLGEKISSMKLDEDLIEQVTSKLINSQGWKGKKFRRYDLSSQSSKLYGGKTHFVNQSVEYGKRIWLDMGFKEMTGSKVVSSFWNFDALFTAQDHPVREMHDTFFIKDVKAKLPEKKLVEQVKKSHEKGVGGSKGWNYEWKEEPAKRVCLRTHTTSASAMALAKLKQEDLPVKYFSLGKVMRNETVDWKHGFEFYQTEGIVVDENANFRNLLGYLTEFYKKMGFEKVKFVPSFFPYTEPSVEIQVWNSERKEWVELGGAGIFRPELSIPLLGKAVPILAWGQGFDRIIMDAYKIKDLRELYSNNIKQLREKEFWKK
jgi:phenylalanyl-tRNA synthetase alpha chain